MVTGRVSIGDFGLEPVYFPVMRVAGYDEITWADARAANRPAPLDRPKYPHTAVTPPKYHNCWTPLSAVIINLRY